MSDYEFNEHLDPMQSPRWLNAPLRLRVRNRRRIERLISQGIQDGVTGKDELRKYVDDQMNGDEDCKAILTIVGLAVLSAVIQWLVTRWLDRRHPKGGS